VILVIGCTLRADRLGVYGHAVDTTPYLDQLARQGVHLTEVLSNAPWTRPGIGALTTGRHPRALGLDDSSVERKKQPGIAEQVSTLGERFTAAGWTSIGATANPNAGAWVGFAQGFAEYEDTSAQWAQGIEKVPGAQVVEAFLADTASVSGPLYGQLVLVDAHRPLGWEFAGKRRAGISLWARSIPERYDAGLSMVDAAVQRLDEGLAAQGRGDRLLIFIGDHGEGLNLPRKAGPSHAKHVYWQNLHIPWIAHGDGVAAGHQVSGLASSVDLMPTLLELAGLPAAAPEEQHGRSLAPALRGQRTDTEGQLVWSVTRYGRTNRQRLTTPGWSYVAQLNKEGVVEAELYKSRDRLQREELSASRPAALSAMEEQRAALQLAMDSEAVLWDVAASGEMEASLEALGYVE
jgi:arylsulfatase A-like enzyme